MIIVSQDKRIITNFDNTIGLQINEHILNSDEERDFEIRAITEKRSCVIAFYDTEARAKKVLQEITKTYFDENCEFENGMYHLQKIYEMPEE